MSLCCECFVLSGRGLFNGPILRPEEFYRLWRVIVCDLEISKIRLSWPALGCCDREERFEIKNHWIYTSTPPYVFVAKILTVLDFLSKALRYEDAEEQEL